MAEVGRFVILGIIHAPTWGEEGDLRQNGLVTRVEGDSVTVLLGGGSECSTCASRNACFGLTGKRRRVEAVLENTVGASVGDLVDVEFEPSASLTLISVSFLLPVAFLVAGYFLAMAKGPVQGAAGAGIGLAAGILIAIIVNRRLASRKDFNLRITGIVDGPACPSGRNGE